MRKRRTTVRRRVTQTIYEWERGWDLAMTRINRVPPVVEDQPFFQECLVVLDGAFADGDSLRFEIGLNFLINFCSYAVDKGDCEPWWN
jgi:hypothetical protein